MDYLAELEREKAYTARVQQLLLAIIEQSKDYAKYHDGTIRMMLSDAWEELRLKPTALSPQDLEQLSADIDRYEARKAFSNDVVKRYERMLLRPFFGRVDFREKLAEAAANEAETDEADAPPKAETASEARAWGETEKIVVGLYSLKDGQGNLLVHDWRAPVCSLYYDAMPGPVAYVSPSGEIKGDMTLKRQYRMEDGRLVYFVDTEVSIDDSMLLDILSGATSQHMQSIVSTIQREQNAAIRHDSARVLSVVGRAGSGKTSVAMHRAAYLMYRQRDLLSANHILVLSPSGAFSEYISTVLPDLGEDNTRTQTLREVLSAVLPVEAESPVKQMERLLEQDQGLTRQSGAGFSSAARSRSAGVLEVRQAECDAAAGEKTSRAVAGRPGIALSEDNPLRAESVAYKSGAAFCEQLQLFSERFRVRGPAFENVAVGKNVIAKRTDLEKMYRTEFRLLSPALRLVRIQTVLDSRLESWERLLYTQYENQLSESYRGKDLEFATKMAVSSHLMPVRTQIKKMMAIDPMELYADALEGAPDALYSAAFDNAAARAIWWEDAPGIAWLMLKLGFAAPDKSVRHIIIDEAQDYVDIALKALSLRFPLAHVTLLGDPNQRTSPCLPECNPRDWGKGFNLPDAPVVTLARCYRSTLPITRLCNALLPKNATAVPFGREGDWPAVLPFDLSKLRETIAAWQEKGYKNIAVVTRTLAEARKLQRNLKGSLLLDGSPEEMLPDEGSVLVSGYHLFKGLEFDAVAVIWPEVPLDDGERRRLYTACSRALHGLCLMTNAQAIRELGIIL